MKNLFKFDCDAARVLSILFVAVAAADVVKSVCLTVFSFSESKKGKAVNLNL